jgi:hypothetical protein
MPDAAPQVPADSDNRTPQDDIAAAPDTSAAGGEFVSPDSPSTPAEDLVAARRQFAERMLLWHDSEECRAAMEEGRRQAEEIIQREHARLGLM